MMTHITVPLYNSTMISPQNAKIKSIYNQNNKEKKHIIFVAIFFCESRLR